MLHPEGRGRIPAYIPKLNGDPNEPVFSICISLWWSKRSRFIWNVFSSADAGVTILVFFADNGEITEGYWFAVAQEATI